MNPLVNGVCDADCLELDLYPVTKQTVKDCLQNICRKKITYDNFFLPIKQALIPQSQIKHVEDIIFTRDTANLGMSR